MTRVADRFAQLSERTRKGINLGFWLAYGLVGGFVANTFKFSVVLAVLAVVFVAGTIIGSYRQTERDERATTEPHAVGPHPKSRSRSSHRGSPVVSAELDTVMLERPQPTTADVKHGPTASRRLGYPAVLNGVCVCVFVVNGVIARGWPRWVLLISSAVSAGLLTIAEIRRRRVP